MRALLAWQSIDAQHGWHTERASDADGTPEMLLLGPMQAAPAPFSAAIPSWSAETPLGSWIEVQLRARIAGRWTSFYRMARWDDQAAGGARGSFTTQRDADGQVNTDTLSLAEAADAIQPRVLLYGNGNAQPTLRTLRVALIAPSERAQQPAAYIPCELPVPLRSQMTYPHGSRICSPTSVAMLLLYWHARTNDPRLAAFADHAAVSQLVAPRVYDPVYDGYGNWSFNTAYAAAQGLDAYVACFDTLAQLEAWIAASVPVVISVAWKAGELAGAPITSSSGHLLIVAGFDEAGRVIVADPRAEHEQQVRRLYDAAQLETIWQRNSNGMVYLIHPHGWPIPSLPT
ncbi:MAG: peptidase C39 family protein [Roseiflexaceae bacterium]